jgi:outer membrane protein OmpA-like peptidoglycan-associated protein
MRHLHILLFLPGKTIFYTLLLYLLSSLVSGCAAFVVAVAGGGAFSYYSGNLVRTYDANYYEAVGTSSWVMEQLRFKATGKKGDALKTVLKGERADNTPVTIVVEMVKPNVTKIGVRNGLVGVSNVKASEDVHKRIGQQLQKTTAAKGQSKSSSIKQIQSTKTKVKISEGTSQPFSTKNKRVDDRYQPESVAPAPTPALTSPFTRSILYIYYTDNGETIPATAYNTLDRVASYLLQNPGASLAISGYTDSKGDPASNLTISKKRANAIRNYLTGKGVAIRQVSAEGYGATNFLGSNRTENLRTMNRRVELQIQ